MLLMASSTRCKLMLTIFPCALQVHFFILPRRKQSLSGMIKVSMKTGDKKLSSLEILKCLDFFTWKITLSSWPITASVIGVVSLCSLQSSSSVREGPSAAELQLAWWPAIVAVQLKKRNLLWNGLCCNLNVCKIWILFSFYYWSGFFVFSCYILLSVSILYKLLTYLKEK